MSATTLEGRLCCASACAYAVIEGESSLDPQAAVPYYAGVGFKQPPAAFLAGTDDINACLVGTTDDGVVVAFRGTLPLDGPFERVGTLLYISSALQIIPDPNNALLDQRRNRLVRLILTGHLQQIGDNHRIPCGYGYMTALCPSGVCPPPQGPVPGSQPPTG